MVECLHKLGFSVTSRRPKEFWQSHHYVKGSRENSERRHVDKPLELLWAMPGRRRGFCPHLVCLGNGVFIGYLGCRACTKRPQAAYSRHCVNWAIALILPMTNMPAVIHGTGPRNGTCTVSIQESFAVRLGAVLAQRR